VRFYREEFMGRFRPGVACLVWLAPVLALAQTAPPIVAVFRIEDRGSGLEDRTLDQLTSYLEVAVAEGNVYRIVPQSSLKRALEEKRQESYRSCYDLACQIELGRELAAEKSLATTILRIGDRCTLTAVLYDLRTQVTDATAKENVGCEQRALQEGIDRAAATLKAYRGGTGGAGFQEGAFGGGQGDWQVGRGKKVIVEFRARPEPVMVMVDGKVICERTPCSRTVAEGLHEVSMLSERYLERRERLALGKGARVEWEMKPNFGWLTVLSEPAGLEVRINSEPAGRTPLARKELAPGGYEVLVVSPCHAEAGERVVLELGREREIALRPVERQAALEVSAKDQAGNDLEAEVLVDGARVGETPDVFKVSICARSLEVRHPGQGSKRIELELAEREVRPVAVVLEPTPPPPPPADTGPPAGEPPPAEAAPVERDLFLGLKVNVTFDLQEAVRSDSSSWSDPLFEASVGMLSELTFDVRLMNSVFLGVSLGFGYAEARSHGDTVRHLGLFEAGGRLGALISLGTHLDLTFAYGVGISMLVTELTGVKHVSDTEDKDWKFDPGYVALNMRLELGVTWYVLDHLGLNFAAGMYFVTAGESTDADGTKVTYDFGPLLYVGLGVVYAL
jgi:hypothetical protein